jgi:hypothetical protein
VGLAGTASWLERIGQASGVAADRIEAAKAAVLPCI